MKGAHGVPVGRAEAQVHSPRRCNIWFDRDREFDPKRSSHYTVVRSSAFAKVDNPNNAKWAQSNIIELSAAFEIGHAE